MSAAEALKAARAVGISIEVDGGDLILQASAAPPRDVIDALSRYKQAIIALMRPASDCWSQEDWRCYFDERVRRAESEGLPRSQAQARAFACCVPEWLNRHMIRSTSGRCVACGRGDRATDLVKPSAPRNVVTPGSILIAGRNGIELDRLTPSQLLRRWALKMRTR